MRGFASPMTLVPVSPPMMRPGTQGARLRFAIVASVAIGCGPTVGGGDGGDSSGAVADSGGTDGTQGPGSADTATGAMTATAASVTSNVTVADSSGADTTLKYDLGAFDVDPDPPGPVDLGEPPDICELPVVDNADIVGTGDFAALSLHAAAFGRAGGGKCPFGLDVSVATDVAALAAWSESNTMPVDSLLINLEVPSDELAPGTWDADFVVMPGGYFFDVATVEVSAVTMLDVAEPMIEGAFMFDAPEGSISGTFSARYCDLLEGGGCGA